MRYDARVDADQYEIVRAARCWGASVQLLHRVGGGCPDLLIGYRGINLLVEVKTVEGELNERQREFHTSWCGQVCVVRSVSQLEKLLLTLHATD